MFINPHALKEKVQRQSFELLEDLVLVFKDRLEDQLRLNFDLATGKSMTTLRIIEIQDEVAARGGYFAESSVSVYIVNKVRLRLMDFIEHGGWEVSFDGSTIWVNVHE